MNTPTKGYARIAVYVKQDGGALLRTTEEHMSLSDAIAFYSDPAMFGAAIPLPHTCEKLLGWPETKIIWVGMVGLALFGV